MRSRRATWIDPIRPVAQPAEPDPCERVELVLQAIELLRRFDLKHALVVADGLARWLEGGDLARALGLRVKRGQRAPMTQRKLRERDDLVRELATAHDVTPAALAREIRSADTERGQRLRAIGAPDSPRHLARIIRGTARRRDMSS